MRAFELYGTDFQALGLYDPAKNKLRRRPHPNMPKRRVTLRDLHRLKHIRNRRRAEAEKHRDLVRTMYGNSDLRELGLERQEQKLETLRDQIAVEIDAAEISAEDKERINKMAMNAIGGHKVR